MKNLKFTKGILIQVLFVVCICFVGSVHSGWYNTDWQFREKLVIIDTSLDNDLKNFPFLVNGSSLTAAFWSNVKTDGSDIVVTDANGITKLNIELVGINKTGKSMELWVNLPILSGSVVSIIYLYCGNSSGAEVNSSATWDSTFRVVHHLSESTDSTFDATPNMFHGRKTSANGPAQIAGKIGFGQSFDGIDDTITLGNIDATKKLPTTVEAWIKADTLLGAIVNKYATGSYNGFNLFFERSSTALVSWLSRSNRNYIALAGEDKFGTYSEVFLESDNWYYLTVTVNKGQLTLYINGEEMNRAYAIGDMLNGSNESTPLTFGNGYGAFRGIIDEVRISHVARSFLVLLPISPI